MASKASAAPVRPSQSEGIDIKQLFNRIAAKWYWFVISIVVCLGYAAYGILKATPIYSSTITVLFKTEDYKGGGLNAMPDLSDIGMGSGGTRGHLSDEMITIKSVSLVKEVVENLGIDDAYYVKVSLHKKLLYKDNPLTVQNLSDTVPSAPVAPWSMVVTLDSPSSFTLSQISGNKGVELKGAVGKPIKTPHGILKVTLTESFDKKYIDEPVTFVHASAEDVAAGISGSITYDLVEFSDNIIDLSVKDPSKARADDILNTLIEEYNRRWIIERNQAQAATSRFIDERLAVIENELGDVEDNISSYKSANLLGAGDNNGVNISSVMQAQAERLELDTRIDLVKYLRRELMNAALDQPLPNPAGITGTTLEGQITAYNALVRERNRMLSTSSETNPLVQDRTNSMEMMRQTMISSIDNLLLSLNSQKRTIDIQEAKNTAALVRSPSQAKYLLSVERQQKVKEQLYLFLLQRREENELTQAFAAYNTRVINLPHGPGGPVSPKSGMAFTLATAIGLAIPLVIIFLMMQFDTKVRTRRDLRNMRVPFLGEIPFSGKKPTTIDKLLRRTGDEQETKRPILVKPRSRNTINEAFRVVRANFEFLGNISQRALDSKDIRVIMTTSMYPGSGKTFISLNIASALAVKGKRVILLDLDMRKASMSNITGQKTKGISNYIIGQASISDIINRDVEGIHGLDMIPVGAIPPNPSEMLYSPKFEQLIETLKKDYSYIIIDCPPVEIVADTQIINRFVDMTVFVVRSGLFEKNDLAKLQEFYDEHRFKNLAVILNAVSSAGYYYGRARYNKGYSGYIHDDTDEEVNQ